MRCLATLLVAVMSIAHLAHTKRVRHLHAKKHEAAQGTYLADPLQPAAVGYGGAASWQLPLSNDPPRVSAHPPPEQPEQNGSSKTWSNLFHGTSTDNEWQSPVKRGWQVTSETVGERRLGATQEGEEGTEKDGEEKKEEPVAETQTPEEEGKEEVKEEDVKDLEELKKLCMLTASESSCRQSLQEEPKSEKSEKLQMKADNEESPNVELTAGDKEIITAKAMWEEAEEELIAAQAAFDAILPSQQFSWSIPMKASTHEETKAKADAQKALDAAKKKVNKARKRWSQIVKAIQRESENMEKKARIAGNAARWEAALQFMPTPLNFPLA